MPSLTRRGFLARSAALAVVRPAQRPNIILCMGDDHGWNETGYNGHPYVRTPVLDDMAARGLRFDRFYAAAPVCSPTRGSIMTGRHPNRYGVFAPNYSIRPEEIALPKLMKQAGYACGHFGKWHLGPVKAGSPTNPGAMGYDTWLAHDNFFEMNPPLVRDGGPPQRYQGESSEIVVREATRYIAKVKQRPFFTVVWFGSPHAPYSAPEKDMALYREGPEELRARWAEITGVDRAMGQLREFLKAEGLSRNTLVWYCGDNGTPRDARLNMTFRGNKGEVYDGGVRVPGIIEWPGTLQARRTAVNAVTSDMLPTICDLTGIRPPARPLDGISLKPLFEGRMRERPRPICFWRYNVARETKESPGPYIAPELQNGTTPTTKVNTVVFRNWRHARARTSDFDGDAAILDNRWKLVAPRGEGLELFDVIADPAESRNLAGANAARVQAMEKQLHEWQSSVERSLAGEDYR
ncbi:MAG: sulfatase [Bryobacteraceae bacterium]